MVKTKTPWFAALGVFAVAGIIAAGGGQSNAGSNCGAGGCTIKTEKKGEKTEASIAHPGYEIQLADWKAAAKECGRDGKGCGDKDKGNDLVINTDLQVDAKCSTKCPVKEEGDLTQTLDFADAR